MLMETNANKLFNSYSDGDHEPLKIKPLFQEGTVARDSARMVRLIGKIRLYDKTCVGEMPTE